MPTGIVATSHQSDGLDDRRQLPWADVARGHPARLQRRRTEDMLPNFFVIGAPRSGTTSLYEYLDAHPDVSMSTVKEPDFFARPSLDAVHPLGQQGTGALDEVAAADPTLAAELAEYEGLFSGAGDEKRRGEASAIYLGHPTAAWHLRAFVPDAPLVAILRDPAERAFSHFIHGRRIYAEYGRTSAVGADDRTVDEEFNRVVDMAYRDGVPEVARTDPEVWIRSGLYFEHLTRWYSLFPTEQLLVALFEDLAGDPDDLMRRIFAFIGVDEDFQLPTTEAFNVSVVPRSRRLFTLLTTKNPLMRYARAVAPARVRAVAMRTRNRFLGSEKPPIDPELHHKLRAIYRDDTSALMELIGRDLSSWMDE